MIHFYKLRVSTLSLIILSVLLYSSVGATPIEVSHPVAGFLRRLEEKGLIPPGFWSTLPRDSREVAAVLSKASENAPKDPRFTQWDRSRLQFYLDEFDMERRRAQTRLHFEDSAFHVVGTAEYFTGIYGRDSLPTANAYGFGSFTPGVEGSYRTSVYFAASGTVSMERNLHKRFHGQYNPAQGLPYNTSRSGFEGGLAQNTSTFDGFRAVIGFGEPSFSLEAGQDWNEWGPGHWQHTTLSAHPWLWAQDSLGPSAPGSPVGYSGNATTYQSTRQGYRYPGEGPPLPQLRLKASGGSWEYTKVVAERVGLSKDSAAFLIAHRLQFRVGHWKVGGTEMLSVGTRRLDAVLFIPGIPLKFAEHSGGDRDNSALSADVEWIRPGTGSLYGEFFLDDFSGTPLDYWGNKFAWVVGVSLQDPLGLPSEWHLEYAHVDPWVYGHNLYNTAFQNYGSLLGSSLPPNSRAVFASASFPLASDLDGQVEGHFRQRDTQSPGSSIFDDPYHLPAMPTTKDFLKRGVETRYELTVSAQWQWNRYVRIKAGGGGLVVNDWHGETGKNLASPSGFGELYLRY